MKILILTTFFAVYFTGCVHRQTINLSDASQSSLSELNRKTKEKEVVITTLEGQKYSGQMLQIAVDSSSWYDKESKKLHTVSTSEIETIAYRRYNRYPLMFAGGAAVIGAAISFEFADNDSSVSNASMAKRTGLILGGLVTVFVTGELIKPSKSKYVFELSIPAFPWPPPEASASMIIPHELWAPSAGDSSFLEEIDHKLVEALNSCEYIEKSYYAVPDGFALVTRLEQINSDGTPKKEPERWHTAVERSMNFSLKEYLEALFMAKPGFFRMIVFVITPHPFTQGKTSVNRDEAIGWLNSGANKLPPAIAKREFSSEYTVTALIYEFVKLDVDKKVSQKIPGLLTGKNHLDKSGLLKAMEH